MSSSSSRDPRESRSSGSGLYRTFVTLALVVTSVYYALSPLLQAPLPHVPLTRGTASAGGGGAPAAPFSLGELTVRNTAYSMILVGPRARQLYAAITAYGLRRVDPDRDILLMVKITEPVDADIAQVLEQLRVTQRSMEERVMHKFEYDFGMCCEQFWGCWMKLAVWNETRYKAVMNVDTDFLVLRSPGPDIFDFMARHATSPFDVGGVADPVVGASHPETFITDVFNGGMFVALPSREAFARVVSHAHGSEWRWGEMLWMNTFATTFGKWVRLPSRYNTFPMTLGADSQLLAYNPINWAAIVGLHFSGNSKVMPDTTEAQCRSRARDCVECCLKWVALASRLHALLAANADVAEATRSGNAADLEAAVARVKAELPQDAESQRRGEAAARAGLVFGGRPRS